MRLQKFGHACLLVETSAARVLLDPGVFSTGFETLDGLDAILVTHQHVDHIDVSRIGALVGRNPTARVIADPATAQMLHDDHGIDVTAASAGDAYDLGGMRVEVVGEFHAEIHPDLPRVPNVGYVVDGTLLHPGDSLDPRDRRVDVLALPTMAPWMRMADAIDFVRAVAPRVAVPIHECLLVSTELYYNAFRALGPEGMQLLVLDDGTPVDV